MACAIQRKYNRVHNNSNNSNNNNKTVNGAKDLKRYVTEMMTLLANIQSEFEADATRASSKFNDTKFNDTAKRICSNPNLKDANLKEHEVRNEMCRVAHNDFVYSATKLPQCSAFLQAKEAAEECLGQIEQVRKMMVTNKQQKKTTIRKLRTLIVRERQTPAIITQHLMKSVALEEEEEEESSPTIKGLRAVIAQTKQNHRTVGKNLLKQATVLMEAMRNQHILTYKTAAESTIGAILNHASACSAFMRQTMHLAVIQFCASRWWNEFEKPAKAPTTTTYRVKAELASGLHAKFDVSHTGHYLSFLEEGCPVPDIQIVVYATDATNATNATNANHERVYCSYMFDDLLAETILTDEAVEEFEEARR